MISATPRGSASPAAVVGRSLGSHAVDEQKFSGEFDSVVEVGTEPGNRAYFGRDVLQGLIEGIDEYQATAQPRWRRRRAGVALLGCVMWLDDEALLIAMRARSERVVQSSIPVPARGLPRRDSSELAKRQMDFALACREAAAHDPLASRT